MNLAAAELRTLIVAPLGRDAAALAETLEQSQLDVLVCADLGYCRCEQVIGAGCLLVTEEALGTPAAGSLIEMLDAQPLWSALPIVVLTTAGANHHHELLERLGLSLGVVTLLERPLRQASLVGAVRVALNARRRQYEVRALLEEQREADRRKDEFLATLAHELRNPLAPLRTGLDILKRTADVGMRARVEAMMEKQLRHMVRLIDDLLDVARIDQGRVELKLERIPLQQVMAHAVETSRPVIDSGGHAFATHVPDKAIYVDGDLVRLSQVVSNLLNNAAQYTPRGGCIDLALFVEDGQAAIRVTDSGLGISPQALPRVFDLFVRADGGASHDHGGLGIGLSLVRGLVAMHGGTVVAKSEGNGRGSVFLVRLPLASPNHEESSGSSQKTTRDDRARRVLVVDDNVDAAEALGLVLELQGHTVEVAYSGATALQAVERFQPGLVLLDLGLPDMHGLEVARAVRALPAGEAISLIAVSGWGRDEDRAKTKEAGFDGHLTKPVGAGELHSVFGDLDQADSRRALSLAQARVVDKLRGS